jgi:Zn-dependent alcohol dehydrogenase
MKAKAAVTRENASGMAVIEYPVPDPGPEEVLIWVTMASVARNDRPRIQKRGQP